MPPKRKSKKEVKNENVEAEQEIVEEVPSEPVVMQLSIPIKQIDKLIDENNIQTMFKYNPVLSEPEPYTPQNNFISENDILETNIIADKVVNVNINQNIKKPANKNHHEIVCFWCCHNIINVEYGMPVRYDTFHNNFTMFGSFCSLECASAYNFSVNMGCDRAWEIHSWIQLLGKKYSLETPIRPAPSRYLLKMFNGPMTIDEFRESHKTMSKTYVMNIPPFIHISSQLEILNTSYLDKHKDTGMRGLIKKKPVSKIDKPTGLEQKMNLTGEDVSI